MVVVVFWDSVCFSVGSADMNMPELIHWSCRVSLVPVGKEALLLFGWVGCKTQLLLRCTDLHKAVSNDKAQSKSLTDLRRVFLTQVCHYLCPALGGVSSAQVPVCCYGEKWPREGAKMFVLLLKGETVSRVVLSLM